MNKTDMLLRIGDMSNELYTTINNVLSDYMEDRHELDRNKYLIFLRVMSSITDLLDMLDKLADPQAPFEMDWQEVLCLKEMKY